MKSVQKTFSTIVRILFLVLINAIGVFIIAQIIPGVIFRSFGSVIVTITFISILNAIIFPLFARFALPLTVFSLGIGGLIINGIVILGVSSLLPGFEIQNLSSAILLMFAITIINTLISALLAIDDDDTYYRNVIKKQAEKSSTRKKTNTPGVIFLQIDGLSYDVLRRAIQSGNVPHISRWIREGKYRFEKWETDWSSQTGASQSGILMGNNDNIPAFRWFDKKLGRTLAFGKPADLKIIEERASNGKGLLFYNGASRGNLLSGDAESTLLTISSIGKKDTRGLAHSYYSYFANPYNIPRTFVLFFIDVAREIKSTIDQNRRDVWPRLTHHKKSYPFLRAAMTIIQRDIIFNTLIGDVYEGRDTVYADLVGYDEVSHHTGPERHETLAILRDIDKQIARLDRAIKDSPKPYHIVLVSDHGQTQGATFKQIMGYGLNELVEKIIGGEVDAQMKNTEDKNMFNNAVLEITKSGGIVGKSFKKIHVSHEEHVQEKEEKQKPKNSDVTVLASGALGLIYFTNVSHRLTLEEIEEKYPNLIIQLSSHPLIGFLLINSKEKGGVVIGKDGKYFLKTDTVVGKNPLEVYGLNTPIHIKRTHNFNNVADIMVNGTYDPILNEVHAFEELIGSHGALGGDQSYPFLLFPSNWYYPDEHLIGASNVHQLMKKWLKKLGQPI